MICKNCGFTRAEHVGDNLTCIGSLGIFRLKITNMTATFLYNNPQGVAESRDCILFHHGRGLARLDNIMHQLLTDGNTDISVNVTVVD